MPERLWLSCRLSTLGNRHAPRNYLLRYRAAEKDDYITGGFMNQTSAEVRPHEGSVEMR